MLWARDMVNVVRVNGLVVLESGGRRRKAAVAIGNVLLSYLEEGVSEIVESALACQCRDPRVE